MTMRITDITDFDKYNFTKDGRVFVKSSGRECPVFKNKDGYLYYNLTCRLGKTRFLRKHRIVAALNHGLPEGHSYLTVNHENGNKEDCHPDNLEWMTSGNNRKHAFRTGLNEIRTCQFKCSVTDQVYTFDSISSCARAMGLTKDNVLYRALSSNETEHLNFGLFRIPASNEPWPQSTCLMKQVMKRETPNGLLVLDLQEGIVKVYNYHTEVANFLGIALSTLSQNLDRFKHPVFKRRWQIKSVFDDSDWIDPKEIELKRDSETDEQKVLVIDKEGKEIIYNTAKEAAYENNLKPTALNYRLDVGQNKFWRDGKKYLRYSLSNGPDTE